MYLQLNDISKGMVPFMHSNRLILRLKTEYMGCWGQTEQERQP